MFRVDTSLTREGSLSIRRWRRRMEMVGTVLLFSTCSDADADADADADTFHVY